MHDLNIMLDTCIEKTELRTSSVRCPLLSKSIGYITIGFRWASNSDSKKPFTFIVSVNFVAIQIASLSPMARIWRRSERIVSQEEKSHNGRTKSHSFLRPWRATSWRRWCSRALAADEDSCYHPLAWRCLHACTPNALKLRSIRAMDANID